MRGPRLLLGIGALLLALAAPAHAAVYTVNGTADPGTCDGLTCTGLQAALTAAAGDKVADQVKLKKATYTASKGLTISDGAGVTVVGTGADATTLTTNGSGVRVLTVSGTATLTHLKVTGGTATDLTGGGIFNAGNLTLDHVEVSGNRASTGAGITNQGALSVAYSLVASNVAGSGDGGILNAGPAGGAGATLAMHDSTVAFNTAGVSGVGGIAVRGPNDSGTLQRVTVADNTGGGRNIGGIGIVAGGLGAQATIVAGNTGGVAANCGPTTPRDDGADVESGTDCGFKSGKQDANPGFPSGLVSDGGETDVLPIPPTSPAVDVGPACSGVSDQRDLARPQGKTCDAGAYEYDAPPDTAITGGPSGLVNSTNATFTFTSTDPGSTFKCSLDNAAPAACAATQTYNGLTQGSHTLSVQALDPAGQADPTPAVASWTVDSVPPNTTIGGSPPTRVNGAISFTFSASEAGSSFQCRLDTPSGAGTYGACTSPRAYSGLAAGNYRFHVVATDAAQNTDPTDATWDFQVDLTPPDTTLTPIADPTNDNTPTFTFSATESGSTFQCHVDKAAPAPCQSPYTTGVLADGSHTFAVQATDAAGNPDPTPASQTFTVDATPPAAPAFTAPADHSLQRSATVTLSGTTEAGATVEVFEGATSRGKATVTGSTWTRTLTLVPDGRHAYTAKATDAAGNASAASAIRTVDVDTGPPAPPLIAAGPDLQRSATVSLTGTAEAGATVEVFEGAASRATTTAPDGTWSVTLAGVADGAHTYTARATDVAGNVSGTSAPRTVTVDTAPPPADVTGGPAGVTSDPAPAFTFGSSDATATFLCRLDGPGGPGADAPCTSPHGFGPLAPGSYTFVLTAVDPAGNPTTTTRSFTVATPQQQQTPPPVPVANKSVVVRPAGGTVLVRLKGTRTFVPLDATKGIPLGSEVDTRHGKVELTSVPKPGAKPQTALFYGGLFIVTQSRGITQLGLSEGLARCPRGKAASAARKKPKSRNLWGDGHGSFRTKGQYSAATVRGTRWNVQDSCAGTLTRVSRGVIAVNDFVKHRTKVLRAGQRYLARPRR